MKKVLKYGVIVLSLILVVSLLAGCGDKEEKSENVSNTNKTAEDIVTDNGTIIATKTETDSEIGTYEQRIEITFKNDEPDKATIVYAFESEEIAESVYEAFELSQEMAEEDDAMSKIDIKINGNEVSMIMTAEEFGATEGDLSESMTREEIKQGLIEDGYTIK